MTAALIIEGVVIVLLAVLVAGLLKSHAEILRQLHALGVTDDGVVTVGSANTQPKTTGFERAPATTLSGVTLDGGALPSAWSRDGETPCSPSSHRAA